MKHPPCTQPSLVATQNAEKRKLVLELKITAMNAKAIGEVH